MLSLVLKAPVMTAADDKFCDILLDFNGKLESRSPWHAITNLHIFDDLTPSQDPRVGHKIGALAQCTPHLSNQVPQQIWYSGLGDNRQQTNRRTDKQG